MKNHVLGMFICFMENLLIAIYLLIALVLSLGLIDYLNNADPVNTSYVLIASMAYFVLGALFGNSLSV